MSITLHRGNTPSSDPYRLDCTDMVNFNIDLLNHNDLEHSFFCLSRDDPTQGFEYDARCVYGPIYPAIATKRSTLSWQDGQIHLRLTLGSHLARYLRHQIEFEMGYTATVGVATNKVLAKLVGNVNKPSNQTTLLPPLEDSAVDTSTVHRFMDEHDIGKIPGIGFKLSQKIRAYMLGRDAAHDTGLIYGGTRENVFVRDVRLRPEMSAEKLDEILSGPGLQKGIGGTVWSLINGVDNTEVGLTKRMPSQISQEDSYMKYLHTFDQVRQQLFLLTERLIERMRIDLVEDEEDELDSDGRPPRRWIAHPRTLRLTTRPRPAVNSDGTRPRTFHRISHSAALPTFVFQLTVSAGDLADKLVESTLTTMFRKLHPERNGWNLSLINIAVSNMAETAADTKTSGGRDIGRMFKRQNDVLKDFRITDFDRPALAAEPTTPSLVENSESSPGEDAVPRHVPEMGVSSPACTGAVDWDEDDRSLPSTQSECPICGMQVPSFASDAHMRFHALSENVSSG